MRARHRASLVVTFLALAESGLVPGTKAGFFCDDPAISFRFRGDTVSLTTLLATTALAPLLVVWLVEAWGRRPHDFAATESSKTRSEVGARLTAFWYREYLLGLGLVLLVTDFAKLLVGEPRPHFLHTCRPNCTAGYIVDFNCTNTDFSHWFIQDSTKSFPSGHASISIYTAFFLVWFLQRRLVKSSWLLVPWLQSLCILWALVCSLTRITDHRHHWWDVLAGAVVGIALGVFTVMVFCRSFTELPVILPNDLLGKDEIVTHENGHMTRAFRSTRHQSVRRLLSSTSSCTGEVTPDEQEMKEPS
ncbi:hypothetical protein R5R35_010952 [Gryllus longicercus]|uniref:Phosphatidic acid phosphatase type 2/haloperoxidase domain-containing protein n=1 Tax=Gryllus longicercus TaxID=2509291 RepID=A0AAN9VWQ6_9ORTH